MLKKAPYYGAFFLFNGEILSVSLQKTMNK